MEFIHEYFSNCLIEIELIYPKISYMITFFKNFLDDCMPPNLKTSERIPVGGYYPFQMEDTRFEFGLC